MGTAVRFKSITNTTGAALTTDGITDKTDGRDKQYRIIQRTLSADDIGTGSGETQHANGCLVEQLPTGANVLSIEGQTFRGGVSIDSLSAFTSGTPDTFFQAGIEYFVNASNQVMVKDTGQDASVQLEEDDVIIIKLVIGPTL